MRLSRIVAVFLAACIGFVGVAGEASAASKRIKPEFFGVQDDWYGRDDTGAWGTARIWAAWCTVQPTAETDLQQSVADLIGGAYQTYADAGVTRLAVSLGHPASWVYNDHPVAVSRERTYIWYCDYNAANTSFPTVTTLRSEPVRGAYITYISAVIEAARPYLEANKRNTLVLQAWNEPNLNNGGSVRNAIPGAAQSWKQASKSLREQERIMRAVARDLIPGRFEISSPALYGKDTTLNKRYFKAQAKKRTIDSVSLNMYTLRQRSVNKSVALWRKKARVAKQVVTRHKRLRNIPIWLTETNHNLRNDTDDVGNRDGKWAQPRVQKRLLEVTTMEALRRGYAGIQWYQGSPTQTAVNTRPGTPASEAGLALRKQLLKRKLVKCSTKKSRTTCTLSSRPGSKRIQVRWSLKGSKGVRILK